MRVAEKIERLRECMSEKGVSLYIVPTADFHQSEYVGEYFKSRKYITGFTGSAGTAIITREKAYLWTDGRYFLQAADQLSGTPVELMKMGEPGVCTIPEFLDQNLRENQVLGFDGRVISLRDGETYEKLAKKHGASVKYDEDLIDMIWTDRPALSAEPAFALDECYTGESTENKLRRIREEMDVRGADLHVLTTLDEICWILNIRGNDVAYSPLLLSYMIIEKEGATLYTDASKLNDSIKKSLEENQISISPYNDIYEDVKKLNAEEKLLIDPVRVNYALYKNIPDQAEKITRDNPVILMKAMKNAVEIENIKKAELKDSVAHIKFMKWLKENVGAETITEISAAEKLDALREEQGNFLQPSFEPICAYGAHGAIVHYAATPESNAALEPKGFFLTDTGAGFYEGSTDITRTYALGELTDEMRDHFTIVAISNLRLANAKFKKGCTGGNLDYLARQPFWDRGLDYNHGTGHGVGYLLNIHEGPVNFNWHGGPVAYAIFPGMVITDEPGIYIEGSHGIRLENEVLCCEDRKTEYGEFYRFEVLTFVPFDLDAINPELLTDDDRKLLNEYHAAVYEKTQSYLDEEEKNWLKEYTKAI